MSLTAPSLLFKLFPAQDALSFPQRRGHKTQGKQMHPNLPPHAQAGSASADWLCPHPLWTFPAQSASRESPVSSGGGVVGKMMLTRLGIQFFWPLWMVSGGLQEVVPSWGLLGEEQGRLSNSAWGFQQCLASRQCLSSFPVVPLAPGQKPGNVECPSWSWLLEAWTWLWLVEWRSGSGAPTSQEGNPWEMPSRFLEGPFVPFALCRLNVANHSGRSYEVEWLISLSLSSYICEFGININGTIIDLLGS